MSKKTTTNDVPELNFKFSSDLLTKYKPFGNCESCQPERLNEETYSEGFFPPPWSINDHPEKTEGWIAFQEAMRNDPDYYKMR